MVVYKVFSTKLLTINMTACVEGKMSIIMMKPPAETIFLPIKLLLMKKLDV